MTEPVEEPTTQEERVLYYTADEALQKAASVGIKVTLATLLIWVDRLGLGFQPGRKGSKWFIYREQFDKFIHGKLEKNHAKNNHAGVGQ